MQSDRGLSARRAALPGLGDRQQAVRPTPRDRRRAAGPAGDGGREGTGADLKWGTHTAAQPEPGGAGAREEDRRRRLPGDSD